MYAKIIDQKTKLCEAGTGTNIEFYASIGMTDMEVEQAYNGRWYIKGFAPKTPTYEEQQENRHQAYISEIDDLHSRRLRHQVIGDWTDDDEQEYIETVIRLSTEIAERYPYPEEQQ